MVTYTTNKALQEPDANSSSWNVPLNSNFVAIDAAFGTTTTSTLSGTTYNLSTSEIANFRIYLNGSPGAGVNVVIPITNSAGSSVGGYWVFENQITTTQTITISNAFGGNTVVIPKGFRIVLFSDPTSGVWIANDGVIRGNYAGTFSTLSTSGNVSIGTATSVSRLFIPASASNTSDIRYSSASLTGNATSYLGIGASSATNIITALDSGNVNNNFSFNTSSSAFPGTPRLKIDNAGNVLAVSKGSSAGLGYGTGAGSTVTQTTSLTTSVTINAPTGVINTYNAFWNNYTVSNPASFTVSNTSVNTNDTVVLSIGSGLSNTYAYFVSGVSTSTFVVTIYALKGTVQESVIINFGLIKGASS